MTWAAAKDAGGKTSLKHFPTILNPLTGVSRLLTRHGPRRGPAVHKRAVTQLSGRETSAFGGPNPSTGVVAKLVRCPDARGVIFEREDVVAAIGPDALAEGRIVKSGGSFFDEVPIGGDHYLLMRVLHDWADEDVVRILRACRAAMQAPAKLLIVEMILEPDPTLGRTTDYLIDMQMMAMYGNARERTETEFRELLTAASFQLNQVIATNAPVSIFEAVPN